MAKKRMTLVLSLCALLAATTAAYAQNFVFNPGFEEGLVGWTPYSYSESPYESPAEPIVGCVGMSPCVFDVIPPAFAPEGSNVCGSQASGCTKNGGVYQVINWVGGAGTIFVTARAYSEKYPIDGGEAWDAGCRVRIGLVEGASTDRADVTDWVTFPWGDAWSTRSLSITNDGVYTLFIESVQPSATAVLSTLWDDVVCTHQPTVQLIGEPTAVKPGNPAQPESTVKIEWTTDVPSTSQVIYGLTTSYGQSISDSTMVAQHSVLLTGLQNASKYHYKVVSSAAGHATNTSDDFTFTTPIQVYDISATPGAVGTSVVIRWKTDVQATSRVFYGLTTFYGQSTTENPTLTTSHEVTLTGLTEDRTYHFKIYGRNPPLYSWAPSADHTFFTLPPPSAALVNGDFEASHGSQQHGLYPWVLYTTGNESIGYKPIDGLVGPYPKAGGTSWYQGFQAYDGSYFLGAAANSDYKNGGVFQRVYYPAGASCTLTARYATLSDGGDISDTRVRLGIDPDGGVDPASANVKWWSLYSVSNDKQWNIGSVTTTSGASGLVTVFLDIRQLWAIPWHVAAVDHVHLGPPVAMTIGALKQSAGDSSAILTDKVVTYVDPNAVEYIGKYYTKAYLEEDDRAAGMAAFFDVEKPDPPAVGNKITLTGSAVLYGMEAVAIADSWTNDGQTHELPKPVLVRQSAIGGSTPIQPALYASPGLCNVGLRMRVCGRVTAVDYTLPFLDSTAYIDDGSGVLDQLPLPSPPSSLPKGIRVKLIANGVYAANIGDYVTATGVLSIEFVDPVWPPNSGDEYYTYTVLTSTYDDWSATTPAAP